MLIDRDDPKPLHIQLTEIIRERINNGIYASKSRLPSEREICDEFGVSRTTVRETLRQLKKEGSIDVKAGRGAFVKIPHRDISVEISLDGFTSDLLRLGKSPSSKILVMEVVNKAADKIVGAMKLTQGDEIVKLSRLRLDNNIPLAIHTVWLNHKLCPQILHHNFSDTSLFAILRETYHLKIERASQSVFAALATSEERKLLMLPNPSSVLHAERTTYLDTGAVIEYSIATYCGEYYRLVIELDPQD